MRRVVVTGLGLVTPLGGDVETSWKNILAGKSGAGKITRFDTEGHKCHIACEVKPADHEYGFDPDKRVDGKVQRQVDPFIVFGIDAAGQATPFASLPASVAAFHLAWGPDDALYVTAPTLSTYDRVYRIDPAGTIDAICASFGRPQGLAFDRHGSLHVVEALAGVSGVYRVERNGSAVQVLSAASIVGLVFDPLDDSLLVASRDSIYRVAR